MSAASGPLVRLDAALYAFEKKLVGGLMLLMSAAMFADVVHRVFSRVPGRLAVMIAPSFGADVLWFDRAISPIIIGGVGWFTIFAALRNRNPYESLAKDILRTTLMLIASMCVVQAFVRLVPQGVVWAPYFSLSLLLWVGLIGASMATYSGRHLALEMGEKIWPETWRNKVRSISGLIAASFALVITVLGTMSWLDHLTIWMDTPEADLIPSVDLPKWTVFWVVPYAFAVIALRYIGRSTGLLPLKAASELDLVTGGSEEAP